MRFLFIVIAVAQLCIDVAWAATCANGWYMNGDTCVQCPQYYLNSVPDAVSINDCYLITAPGEYVAAAGATPVLCAENHYCPGSIPVFYDLKSRYVTVDYIHGTGTQYIDTGVILGSDIDTEMVFEAGYISGDAVLFGAASEDGHYWLNGYGNSMYIRYNDYHPFAEHKGSLAPGKKSTLVIKSGEWIFNGKSVYANSGTFNVGRSGYLFTAHRNDGSNMWIHPSLKVYSFTQWRDGDLVLDLVPVYDLQTGQYGMWDNVEHRFLGNVGTGEFGGGSLLTELSPDGSVGCAVATDNVAPYSPLGADDIMDCGYVMHIGENQKLYLHSEKRTSPSLAAQIKNHIFYADTSLEKHGILRVKHDGQILSVYNMDADD